MNEATTPASLMSSASAGGENILYSWRPSAWSNPKLGTPVVVYLSGCRIVPGVFCLLDCSSDVGNRCISVRTCVGLVVAGFCPVVGGSMANYL